VVTMMVMGREGQDCAQASAGMQRSAARTVLIFMQMLGMARAAIYFGIGAMWPREEAST
jgi:hypothetical protein